MNKIYFKDIDSSNKEIVRKIKSYYYIKLNNLNHKIKEAWYKFILPKPLY